MIHFKIDSLRALGSALLNNKSNIIVGAEKKMKTKNRDSTIEFVGNKLSITKKRLEPVFNPSDSNYDTLFRKPQSTMKVKEFLMYCNDILKVFYENKELLATVGFDDASITAFEEDIALLNKAETEREQAEISYNNDSFERSEARRITYAELDFIASMNENDENLLT